MKKIAVLSSSVRDGDRLSHRVALFFKKYLQEKQLADVTFLDLKEYNFPVFTEQFGYQKNPSAALLDFTKKFTEVDALIIVTPVYNASFPASLKNVIDLYLSEWKHKVVAVSTVTYGTVPPMVTLKEVQYLMLKLGAMISSVGFMTTNTANEYDIEGNALDIEKTEKLLRPFLEELTWLMEKMK